MAEFAPFSYGNVLAQAENIRGARTQNALAQSQIKRQNALLGQEQATFDQAQQDRARTHMAQQMAAIASSPSPTEAVSLLMRDPEFQQSSKALGIPLERFAPTQADDETIRRGAMTIAQALGAAQEKPVAVMGDQGPVYVRESQAIGKAPYRMTGTSIPGSLQELAAVNADRQAQGLPPISAEEYLTQRRQTSADLQAYNQYLAEAQMRGEQPSTFADYKARVAGEVKGAQTTAEGQAKIALDLPQAKARLSATESKMDRLAQAADAILNDEALWRAVGVGRGLSAIPSSAGARVKAKIDNLQSQAGLAVLQDMRDNSKTGGAVGQVSDYEQKLLQNVLAPLANTNVSPEDYRRAVEQIKDYALQTKERFRSAFSYQYPGLGQNGAQQQAPSVTPVISELPRIQADGAGYEAIPSGSQYIAPDGTVRTKQ